jgi:serine/threonine protein kinase
VRLPPGSMLGRYEMIARIGSGGMGDVYRARDTRLNKAVAVKTIAAAYAEDPASQPRFERERRLTASLEHPHICRLLDAGREADVEYFAMEYLDGESLAQRLTHGPLPAAEAIGYAIEVADAPVRPPARRGAP